MLPISHKEVQERVPREMKVDLHKATLLQSTFGDILMTEINLHGLNRKATRLKKRS